jgi:hypothetical protein
MKKNNDFVCDSCNITLIDVWSENDEVILCDDCQSIMRRKFLVGGTSTSIGKCGNASTGYSTSK